jgi:hypothetical protein
MILTSKEAKLIFQHLFDNVLDLDADSSLRQSLFSLGIANVCALLAIKVDDIWSLIYSKSPMERDVPVKLGEKNKLTALFSYIAHLQCMGCLANSSDWFQISMQGYDKYRISALYHPSMNQFGPIDQLEIPELMAESPINLTQGPVFQASVVPITPDLPSQPSPHPQTFQLF